MAGVGMGFFYSLVSHHKVVSLRYCRESKYEQKDYRRGFRRARPFGHYFDMASYH